MKTRIFIATFMAVLFASAASHAQTSTWTNGSTNGIWDTTPSNWNDGIGDLTWQNGDAEFGAGTTPGTVTIGTGGISATSLTFDTTGYTITSNTLTLTGAQTITTNADAAISSVISGSLIKAGSGTLTLSGTSVVGNVTINTGVLDVTGQIYDSNAWTGPHAVTVNTGGTLRLYSWGFNVPGGLYGVGTGALNVNGGTIEMAANANTWWNANGIGIGASGATLLVDSSVTWAVGANTYTGNCQSVTNNSSLTLDGAGTGNMYMAILGTGSVTKNGSGTWALNPFVDGGSTANSYSGATTINSGTLQAGGANALSGSSAVTLANTAGVALNLNGYNNTVASLSGGGSTGGNLIGGGTLTTGSDNTSTTFAGAILGASIDKVGTGTLTLSSTASNAGSLTVDAGVLDLTGQLYNAFSGAVTTVNSGATLRLYSWGFNSADGLGLVGAYYGNVVLNGGTIDMAAAGGSYGSRGLTTGAGGGTLNALNTSGSWYFDSWAGGSQIENDTSLTLTGPGNGQIHTVIQGAGSLIKSGAGTWVLDYANTYTGNTTVNAGKLQLTAAGSITASPLVEIKDGATFDTTSQSFTMLGTQTFKFTINGTTGLTGKLVAGVLDITAGVVDFSTTGFLSAPAYVIASYTSLTGSAFNTVLDLPTGGWYIDYNYLGLNEIALVVPEPSTWTMLLGGIGMLTMLRRRRA